MEVGGKGGGGEGAGGEEAGLVVSFVAFMYYVSLCLSLSA